MAERIERGYLDSLLRLTLLAPDIVEAIMAGRQPAEPTLPGLMMPFPWSGNAKMLLYPIKISRETIARA